MSEYIVSARKYRPLNFDSVVGQRALTTTLKNSIASGKLAHAYLFCGPRGVGKTTCARIFAKAINCMNPQTNGDACGKCESCLSFDQQRSMNIHELDAASNNSVEDIREISKQVLIPPQNGKYRVFIIDEVHMLSSSAFNAFLKTLEEPPSYVIFILATTEKHKILPTILSRCQVYDFQRMTTSETVEHLKYVAQKEGYTAEDEALDLIAEKSDGGMRDALTIFDQMVSFTGGHLTTQLVSESLNVLSVEYHFRFVQYFLENNSTASLLLLDEILKKGFDAGQLVSSLSSHLRNLLVSRDPATVRLLEVSESLKSRYIAQAQQCTPRFLFKALRLCNECDQHYRTSRNKRLQVEICLLQACSLTSPDDSPSDGPGPQRIVLHQTSAAEQAPATPVERRSANSAKVSKSKVPAKGTKTSTPPLQPSKQEAPVPPQKTEEKATSTPLKTKESQAPEKPSQRESSQREASLPERPLKKVHFPNLMTKSQDPDERTEEEEEPEDLYENMENYTSPLTTANVRLAWQKYIQQELQGDEMLAQRLKAIQPNALDENLLCVTAPNEQLLNEIVARKAKMLTFFKKELKNYQMELRVELSLDDNSSQSMTKEGFVQALQEQNPSISFLIEKLNLSID